MTDADRLLAAAQMLEITGFSAIDADPSVKQRENRERNATAALLRAVADYQARRAGPQCLFCDEYPVDDHGYDCPWVKALALADAVLGVTDE